MAKEEQFLKAKDNSGFFNFLFYDAGIAHYPSLFGVYISVYVVGSLILFVAFAVVKAVSGFVEFPESGGLTVLGGLVFFLQLFLPLIPVAYLELARRRGHRTTIERGLATGFAKLIPWAEVRGIELRPIRYGDRRPGYGRWWVIITTSSKTYKARLLNEPDKAEVFFKQKIGGRLLVSDADS